MSFENFTWLELSAYGIAIIGISWLIASAVRGARASAEALEAALLPTEDFHPSQRLVSADNNTALAIDEKRSKLLILYRKTPELAAKRAMALHQEGLRGDAVTNAFRDNAGFDRHVYMWKDIIAADIAEDGGSVTRTSRSSQIGSAAIGGAVFGPVGAMAGALTGKTQSHVTVRNVELIITVNDLGHPLHRISLLSSPVDVVKTSASYRAVQQRAQQWQGIFRIILHDDQSVRGGRTPTNWDITRAK